MISHYIAEISLNVMLNYNKEPDIHQTEKNFKVFRICHLYLNVSIETISALYCSE